MRVSCTIFNRDSVVCSFEGWKHGLTEWNEFLAEDLQNSRDAPQECFVPVSC